mmetsp:Transcript_139308/g.445415  ORF Transcript_139308/g.445415 Transcript_139308/m.445415 type:complete len:211 (-) Transcript_139308:730-1362(-)
MAGCQALSTSPSNTARFVQGAVGHGATLHWSSIQGRLGSTRLSSSQASRRACCWWVWSTTGCWTTTSWRRTSGLVVASVCLPRLVARPSSPSTTGAFRPRCGAAAATGADVLQATRLRVGGTNSCGTGCRGDDEASVEGRESVEHMVSGGCALPFSSARGDGWGSKIAPSKVLSSLSVKRRPRCPFAADATNGVPVRTGCDEGRRRPSSE